MTARGTTQDHPAATNGGRETSAFRNCGPDVTEQQQARIDALEQEVMELRAAVVVRDTALAWMREELETVKAAVPGLPKRLIRRRQAARPVSDNYLGRSTGVVVAG